MGNTFGELVSKTRAWFEGARAAGWLDEADLDRLNAVERATPSDLFADEDARPLVVAFFGGTGAGKSSLLNRLAGARVARTGVERPTSREVTLFVHESVRLADLPAGLPVEDVCLERHASDEHRDVLWIDAPDIDSTQEENRRRALACLPHVDLVVYVVSPERYRDDVGWRVLLERGQKHGWMFVMNRWDEGDPSQRDDCAQMLRGAGFDDPLLLVTCCADRALDLPSADQFERIQQSIDAVLAAHGVRELERLGHRARLLELRAAILAACTHLGEDEGWTAVSSAWERHWQRARATILEGIEWPMRNAAGRLAARESTVAEKVTRTVGKALVEGIKAGRSPERKVDDAPVPAREADPPNAPAASELAYLTESLWDDWPQSKLDGCVDVTEIELRRAGIAAGPLRARLEDITREARDEVMRHVQDEVRTALARRGGGLHRALRRVLGFLTAALPSCALAWVAYVVVRGFLQASAGDGAFFGTEFAVHSALLVGVAWALPFTLDRLMRPSVERLVLRVMRRGFAAGLDAVAERVVQGLAAAGAEARAHLEGAKSITDEISAAALRPVRIQDSMLSRVIAARPRESVGA